MSSPRRSRALKRALKDVMIGLAAFYGLFFIATADHADPMPVPIASLFLTDAPAGTAGPAALHHSRPFAQAEADVPIDRAAASSLLAVVFAGIVAFNLWMLRQLRRVHAIPRRWA